MRAVAILAVLVAGLLLWLFASEPGGDAAPAPAPAGTGAPPPPEIPDAVSVERNPLSRPEQGPARGDEPPAEPAGRAPEQPAAAGTLHLEVRSRADGSPLPAFRYVLVHGDGRRDAERVEGHALDLHLDLDRPAVLTVEAEGHEPSAPLEVSLTQGEPERHLPVLLLPAAAFAGVELWVRTPDSLPVQHLEVEVLALDHLGPEAAGRSLWRRSTSDEHGRYRLPGLAPGSYRLRLRALTALSEVAAWVPHVEEVAFGGTELVRRHVVLRPGGFIDVQVLDWAGGELGPEVDLRLVHPDGSAPGARWVALVDGEPIERLDGLPAPGRARLAEPVPPGQYRLQARIGAGAVAEQPVAVAAGQEHSVSVRLPR